MKTIIKTALFAGIVGLVGQSMKICAYGTITSILNEQNKVQHVATLENAKNKIITTLSIEELGALKSDESVKYWEDYYKNNKKLDEARYIGYQDGKENSQRGEKEAFIAGISAGVFALFVLYYVGNITEYIGKEMTTWLRNNIAEVIKETAKNTVK